MSLATLGQDVLCFLASTVVVIPVFKRLKISPVLGFLACGLLLKQLGLTKDLEDLERLSELGVLFLLFEMGLELSLDRLKALAKYAFGLGTLQMIVCTSAFSLFALPVGNGLGTNILEKVASAPASLVSIRTVDEAVVIGGALAMSSSAFVLQLLTERGEMPTRSGSATLGILLLQDIAVVPFLVLLPLIESDNSELLNGASASSLLEKLGPTALQTVLGLGLLLVGGRVVLRRVFEVVAGSRNPEAFLALCLLTVSGAAYITSHLGFSDTMGAFIAGVLLSETNYKTQVEADVKPFRGLLLGLFFTTTAASINMSVLTNNWQVIAWILAGLLTCKTAIIATLAKSFGLTTGESLRIGFMLSQAGEFAFVLLSLAASLKVLPEDLNQVLIIVVVLSMALTPALTDVGKRVGDWLEELESKDPDGQIIEMLAMEDAARSGSHNFEADKNPIVISGFGPHGQMMANIFENPMVMNQPSYVVFDLDPTRVQMGRQAGFPVIFGDGSRRGVYEAAGIEVPRAVVVCHGNRDQALQVVGMIRGSYPGVPVYACGLDLNHAAELERAGAIATVVTPAEAGLAMGCRILSAELKLSDSEVAYIKQGIDEAMASKVHDRSLLLESGQEGICREIIKFDSRRQALQAPAALLAFEDENIPMASVDGGVGTDAEDDACLVPVDFSPSVISDPVKARLN